VIRSFKDKEAHKIWNQEYSKKYHKNIQGIIFRKFVMISRAKNLDDLRIPPANNLEKLRGDRKDQYSIRINDQFRICFKWQDGEAYDIEIVDYH
jgi:proteic killer suppression protein